MLVALHGDPQAPDWQVIGHYAHAHKARQTRPVLSVLRADAFRHAEVVRGRCAHRPGDRDRVWMRSCRVGSCQPCPAHLGGERGCVQGDRDQNEGASGASDAAERVLSAVITPDSSRPVEMSADLGCLDSADADSSWKALQ